MISPTSNRDNVGMRNAKYLSWREASIRTFMFQTSRASDPDGNDLQANSGEAATHDSC